MGFMWSGWKAWVAALEILSTMEASAISGDEVSLLVQHNMEPKTPNRHNHPQPKHSHNYNQDDNKPINKTPT